MSRQFIETLKGSPHSVLMCCSSWTWSVTPVYSFSSACRALREAQVFLFPSPIHHAEQAVLLGWKWCPGLAVRDGCWTQGQKVPIGEPSVDTAPTENKAFSLFCFLRFGFNKRVAPFRASPRAFPWLFILYPAAVPGAFIILPAFSCHFWLIRFVLSGS